MREITREVTKTEVIAYEASDGTRFNTREECEKYENSSEYAIIGLFNKLMIDKPFAECSIFEDFGYGSEEYLMCAIEIKDENDLRIARMYQEDRKKKHLASSKEFTTEMIGKKILVGLGYEYDGQGCYINGTYDELVKRFAEHTQKYFERKEVE